MDEKQESADQQEHNPAARRATLFLSGVFFLLVVPLGIVFVSALLDQSLRLPLFGNPATNTMISAVLMAAGFVWAMWAVYVQVTQGHGTPVPAMAPRKLIVDGPYQYSRNPMALGTIMLYLGLAVALGSYSAVIIVLVLALLLLFYIRKVEEKKMAERYGEAYQQYRESTPFIIPRLRKSQE